MTIYQEELKRRLKAQGYGAVYDEESGMLKIYHNGAFLCDQGKNGELGFDSKIINDPHYIWMHILMAVASLRRSW